MYCRAGYPIGMNSESPFKSFFELRGDVIEMTFRDYIVWAHLGKPNDEIQDDMTYNINKLIEKGLFIEFEPDKQKDFFEAMKDLKLFRQGFSAFGLNQQICLSKDPIEVNDLQLEIWRKSNGVRTIEQIYSEMTDVSIMNFMDETLFLEMSGFVYIV
jgi:hypothetical protein